MGSKITGYCFRFKLLIQILESKSTKVEITYDNFYIDFGGAKFEDDLVIKRKSTKLTNVLCL